MGLRAGTDVSEERYTSSPAGNRNTIGRSTSPWPSHYTDCTVQVVNLKSHLLVWTKSCPESPAPYKIFQRTAQTG